MNKKLLSIIFAGLLGFTGCRGENSKSGQADSDLQSSNLSPSQASVGQTKATELPAQVRAFLPRAAVRRGVGQEGGYARQANLHDVAVVLRAAHETPEQAAHLHLRRRHATRGERRVQ